MNEIESEEYIQKRFGISKHDFFEIIKNSPGADGYILGAIGEQLFKKYAETKGYEVYRIKEKPEGGNNAKTDEARGDFSIRKKGITENKWYVIECKSVKSNSEDRAGLTKKKSLITYLRKHSISRNPHINELYTKGYIGYQQVNPHYSNFPAFSWLRENPGPGVPDLTKYWHSEMDIKRWLDTFDEDAFSKEAYAELRAPVRLIQTHMPSQRTDKLGIKSTGPLKDEFNILCLDLFIRTGKHEFVFVNSQNLNAQAKSPNHLQQNYTVDILLSIDNYQRHPLLKPWYDDLDKCISETQPVPREMDETQLDYRKSAK